MSLEENNVLTHSGRMPGNDRGTDHSDTPTSQGSLRITSNQKIQERDMEQILLQNLQKKPALQTP